MPQFQAGGGYDAIQQFMLQREMQRRQQMLDELMQQQQAEQSGMRQREMALREQEAARRERMDTEASEARATQQRSAQNTIGVRGMMADALTQGPLTPDSAKTIGIMAFREGMDAPPEVQQMQAQEEEARTRSAGLADYEARQMIDASTQPREEPDRFMNVGGAVFDRTTESFRTPPEPGGRGATNATTGEGQPSPYAIETARRTIQAIDDVLPKINNLTAGGGSLLKMVPGSEAANVSAELSSVAANVAFNALQAMREASKTGGALGQVSERELDLLSAVSGSIRQNQSPDNLKIQLGKIRESMARFQAAAGGGGDAGGEWITLPSGVRVRKKAR